MHEARAAFLCSAISFWQGNLYVQRGTFFFFFSLMTEQFSSLGWNILFTMEMLGECIKVKRTIIPSLYYLWHAIDGMWGGGIKLVRGSHDVDSSSPYCHLFSRRTWWWRKTTPSLFPLGWSEKTEKERSLLADFFFFFFFLFSHWNLDLQVWHGCVFARCWKWKNFSKLVTPVLVWSTVSIKKKKKKKKFMKTRSS